MLNKLIRNLTFGIFSREKPVNLDAQIQELEEIYAKLSRHRVEAVTRNVLDHKIRVRQWFPFGVAVCFSLKFQICAGHRKGMVVVWRCPGALLNDHLTEAYNVQCGRAYYENADGTLRPKRNIN